MPENTDEVGQKLGTPITSEDVEDLKDPRQKAWQRAEPREPIRALGIRPYKLGSGTTSEYGRYVKSLGEPCRGQT